jgi:hypothetical protein
MIMAGYDGTVAYPTKCTEVSTRSFLFIISSCKGYRGIVMLLPATTVQ